MLSRNNITAKLTALMANPAALQQEVEDTVSLPDNIAKWLGRLKLLYGVPINYLVPDEAMLPPESIRFFYLDFNWIDALLDGAYSIGRNLTVNDESNSLALDRATTPMMKTSAINTSAAIRSRALGVAEPVVSFKTVSGFLLRSSVVQAYPGLGVNPYPKGHTPNDGNDNVQLLNILRMERLGPNSDTLICIVEGDIYRADIHEAPEALHYGIDSFEITNNTITSQKTIYTFTQTGPPGNSSVTMDTANPLKLNLVNNNTGNCFRAINDPRTIKMNKLSTLIAQSQVKPLNALDASEMGFEMIEGVGMVSFYNKNS
jgi:hypothetical protein